MQVLWQTAWVYHILLFVILVVAILALKLCRTKWCFVRIGVVCVVATIGVLLMEGRLARKHSECCRRTRAIGTTFQSDREQVSDVQMYNVWDIKSIGGNEAKKLFRCPMVNNATECSYEVAWTENGEFVLYCQTHLDRYGKTFCYSKDGLVTWAVPRGQRVAQKALIKTGVK